MSRLDILKASLEKKQAKFDRKLNEHFADVKSTNGQPLNDKRNGFATMKRWDRQNDVLSRMQKEIEKTQTAIEREESRIRCIDRNKNSMPEEIQELIDNGTLKQWGKYPHIMFVEGVDKARIIWDSKKKMVMHKFVSSIIDTEQRKKFARVYNSLNNASINKQNKK
uniref:hypothetical protein n=1 Tax=Bacteroides uniformis TaxID=820 RepID=UPI0040286DC9